MFTKKEIDALFAELRKTYYGNPQWELLNRHAHLGVARSDAGMAPGNIDPRIVALIEKHKPKE